MFSSGCLQVAHLKSAPPSLTGTKRKFEVISEIAPLSLPTPLRCTPPEALPLDGFVGTYPPVLPSALAGDGPGVVEPPHRKALRRRRTESVHPSSGFSEVER